MRASGLAEQITHAEERADYYLRLARKLRLALEAQQAVRIKRGPYFRRRYNLTHAAQRRVEKAQDWMRRAEEVDAGLHLAMWGEL